MSDPSASVDGNPPRLFITKMVLENFKSYGGVREVGPFHKRFSSIVGPNGSGKSNVIDAMLFVFGKKAKKLRLNKVSELIHKSDGYQNLEYCRVSVHFVDIIDNPDHEDKFEEVPGTELTVTRIAYKNNSSKYLLDDKNSTFTEVGALLRKRGIDLDNNRFLILQGEVEQIAMMPPKAKTEHDEGLLEFLEDIIGSNRHLELINEEEKKLDVLNEERGEKLARLKVTETERDNLEGAKSEAESAVRKAREVRVKQNILYQKYCADAKVNVETISEQQQELKTRQEYEKKKLKEKEKELEAEEEAVALIVKEHEGIRKEVAQHLQIDQIHSQLSLTIDESPLTKEIRMVIDKLGPMTVADFMSHALQHPEHGYYTGQDSQIGQGGDFVTAPEISQLFGEAIGIWCVSVWESMGKPEHFNLVEMGPGKGTLMKDVLRTAKSFPQFRKAASVHLVETSPFLREKQKETLGARPLVVSSDVQQTEEGQGKEEVMRMKLPDGGDIEWHSLFMDVPQGPLIFIGQEILDAFPIHQFEYTENGWRELLVANQPEGSIPPFKIVTSKYPTPAVAAYLTEGRSHQHNFNDTNNDMSEGGGPKTWRQREAQVLKYEHPTLILNNASLSNVKMSDEVDYQNNLKEFQNQMKQNEIMETSNEILNRVNRSHQLQNNNNDQKQQDEKMIGYDSKGAVVGDRIEVCPQALALTQDIASRISKFDIKVDTEKQEIDGSVNQAGGGAIFIDYGVDHALTNSLRGFHKHTEAHVLSRPGEVDLTADVDFAALRNLVSKMRGVRAHGPVTQGSFLNNMGVPQRLINLIEQPDATDEQIEKLIDGYGRLVDAEQMGERYKVFVVVDEEQEGTPPGCFDMSELEGEEFQK